MVYIADGSSAHYLWAPSGYFNGDKTPVSTGDIPRSKMLAYIKKIVDENDYSKVVGLVEFNFSQKDIAEILNDANSITDSITFIMNKSSDNVASSKDNELSKYHLKGSDFFVSDVSVDKTEWSSVSRAHQKFLVGSRQLANTDWVMTTVIPISNIIKESQPLTISLLIMLIFIFMVSCLFFYYLSNSITRRIAILAKQMKSIHTGHLKRLKPSSTHDEIGSLIDTYNYMVNEIDDLVESQYQSGINLKTAELKALQAQINPHFLYNTLEMINWYAWNNYPDKITRTVDLLSKFYKLSLNKGKDIYSIGDELNLVLNFFELQNMRFGNRLSLTYQVPEGLLQFTILKITLQPIIENAIRHGILAKESKTGIITISAELNENTIVFKITDDGIGIDSEKLRQINNGTTASHESETGSSYGIKSVNERIKIYYGNQYGLHYESIVGTGTTVTLKIPACIS